MSDITVVLTSCRRPDLLQRTLDSFFAANDYPLAQFIVIEDSDDVRIAEVVASYQRPELRLIMNAKNIGQHASIDRAYGEVKTPYILHLEDDWVFPKAGFIAAGIEVLKTEPAISLVQLRTERDMPKMVKGRAAQHLPSGLGAYHVIPLTADRTWHSFTFNPSVKRLSDYLALQGGYRRFRTEAEVSIHYKEQRRPMAWLMGTGIDHIGWERSNFGYQAEPGAKGLLKRAKRFLSLKTLQKWVRSLKRRIHHLSRMLRSG